MREWDEWLKPLVRKFQRVENLPLDTDSLKRFLQVELCLRLRERLIPDRPCGEVWSLLTGYRLEGLHDSPEARRMCAIARSRVRYLRTATAWQRWLEWYAEQPGHLRLYDVDLETGQATERPLGPAVVSERLEAYDASLDQPASHRERHPLWAEAGQYRFTVGDHQYSVTIPESLASIPQPDVPSALPAPRARAPIRVSLNDLERAAAELARLDPEGDWVERARRLSLTLVREAQLEPGARAFTIDGLFYLVGMVGAGKTTLIHLLIYHLVVERALRVTLMLNTVVESLQVAAALRRVGINAAPALGTDRAAHRLKYGQATSGGAHLEDQLFPDVQHDPALRWLTGPCLLSGALTDEGPIPPGLEPCQALYNDREESHVCPALPICPVHQAQIDLPDSPMWIVNPASFLHSQAPLTLSRAEMRLLEAVYRTSDVLIIDEADRVQVQWDRKYAPVDNLAGHQDALLDWLDVVLAVEFARHGRRQLVHPRNNELKMLANEANRLSNWVMHMLFNHQDLVEWLGRQPVTNASLYAQLADDLARPSEDAPIDEATRNRLHEEFRAFYDHPTSLPEGGPLASLVNDVRHEEEASLTLHLQEWLQERLPWPLASHPQAAELLRRLEFSLLLTAMDKRVDNLLRNWLWAAPEFGERRVLDQSPPQEYVDLLPESPLGNLLGYQYAQRQPGGLLKYIQCHGIGRWLLMRFRELYADVDGLTGPHVLLTSATSWAPGSPQFHLGLLPDAILTPPEAERRAIETSRFRLIRVPDHTGAPIRVSGLYGPPRTDSLERLVRYLASSAGGHPAPIENELAYWRETGIPRKVLLIVGSYAEARRTVETLATIPGWRGRAMSMQPDYDDSLDAWLIRRGEVEQFNVRKADVLVAPLLAIQRGFNILDEAGGALLGSVFFLVRPYPVPDDIGQHVLGVNAWAMRRLEEHQGRLAVDPSQGGAAAIRALRHDAYREWRKRLTSGRHGMDGLDEGLYRELLWDQFVVIWQTIGRLVRRGRSAHVFFVDAAFNPPRGRSMLRGWRDMLGVYLDPETSAASVERELAETLYGPAYLALNKMITEV